MEKDLKFFVVDDDMFFGNLLAQQIRNLGFDSVETILSGDECTTRLNEKPDIIFLDYNLDNMTGYDVLKRIKRYNPDIYVVMVSGQEDIKPAVDALKHGAFDYIQKSDDEVMKIHQVINKIIEVKELINNTKPNVIKKLFQFL